MNKPTLKQSVELMDALEEFQGRLSDFSTEVHLDKLDYEKAKIVIEQLNKILEVNNF